MTADIQLTLAMLGLRPYVLIEAKTDDDGDLALDVSGGGGAEEQMEALPYLFVSNLPADRDTVTKLAAILGVPMPEVTA